jgi:hypothetical protein
MTDFFFWRKITIYLISRLTFDTTVAVLYGRPGHSTRDAMMNEISLINLTGIANPLDFETLRQTIHDQCTLALDCNQVVDKHINFSQKLGFPGLPFAFLT